jgi:hypothetical protein
MEAAILAQMMLDEDDAEADEDLLLAAVLEEAHVAEVGERACLSGLPFVAHG